MAKNAGMRKETNFYTLGCDPRLPVLFLQFSLSLKEDKFGCVSLLPTNFPPPRKVRCDFV